MFQKNHTLYITRDLIDITVNLQTVWYSSCALKFLGWGGRLFDTRCLLTFPLFSFAKKIVKAKVASAEALTSLRWVSLRARRFGHRCCVVQDAMKGSIPEHFGVFRSNMNQQHGYNTRNGYVPKISMPRTELGRSKTYYKAINDWATLPSTLKKPMPKTIFKYKLKHFLLNRF